MEFSPAKVTIDLAEYEALKNRNKDPEIDVRVLKKFIGHLAESLTASRAHMGRSDFIYEENSREIKYVCEQEGVIIEAIGPGNYQVSIKR